MNFAPPSAKRSGRSSLLRAYLNAEVRDQLVAGDVWAAQLWSTTAQQAIDAAPHLAFVYPAEGFAIYPDNAVILRESRHRDAAYDFLNYLLRPAVAAAIVIAARTATANGAARAILPAIDPRQSHSLPRAGNHGPRRMVAYHVGRHPAAAGPPLDRGKVELDAPGCRPRSPGQSGRLGSRTLVLFRPRVARTARQDACQLPAAGTPAVVAELSRRRRDQGHRHPRCAAPGRPHCRPPATERCRARRRLAVEARYQIPAQSSNCCPAAA